MPLATVESGSVLDVLSQVFVVGGALFFSTAGIGLLRLRDVYARSSAIATAAGLGVSSILVGVFLREPGLDSGVKLVIAVVLQLATSAVGSMAIARAAYLTGSPMRVDEDDDSADPDWPNPGVPDELAIADDLNADSPNDTHPPDQPDG